MRVGHIATITMEVAEASTGRLLQQQSVVFLGEPGDKAVDREEALAKPIGLNLDNYSRNVSDVLFSDVHSDARNAVFVEVVATDGAMTVQRKASLLEVATNGGMNPENVYFVSAFADRTAPAFRRLVSELAWGTFAWFRAEPEKLIAFREGEPAELSQLFSYCQTECKP